MTRAAAYPAWAPLHLVMRFGIAWRFWGKTEMYRKGEEGWLNGICAIAARRIHQILKYYVMCTS